MLNSYFVSVCVLNIAIDLGSSWTKVKADNNIEYKIPTLYCKRSSNEVTGNEALKLYPFSDTMKKFPLIKGNFKGNELEIKILLKNIIDNVRKNTPIQECSVIMSIPQSGSHNDESLRSILEHDIGIKNVQLVNQGLGFLANHNVSDAVCISFGYGTCEILILYQNVIIIAKSLKSSCSKILHNIPQVQLYQDDFKSPDCINDISKQVVLQIINEFKALYHSTDLEDMGTNLPIFCFGGGLLLEGVKDTILNNLDNVTISDDPIFGEVRGLYKISIKESVNLQNNEQTA